MRDTPFEALGALGVSWVFAWATLPEDTARVIGLAAAQGALLGTALAWTPTGQRRDRWAPIEAGVVLGLAAAAARLHAVGAVFYLLVPAWLAARRPDWLGPRAWRPVGATVTGALFGLLLGGHLLVTTSLTFGYRVRTGPLPELVEWWAYDLAVNVVTAEAFFRGALFTRVYRRWAFGPAVGVAAAAAVARYLADPLLPHSLAVAVGAVFYIALLGAANCWLVARTGRLGPGLAAAALFFGAYRLLVPR